MELKLRIDGVDHRVQAQVLNGTLWLHHEGRTLTMDANTGRKARKKGGVAGSSDQIAAPMPGKITKILAPVGTLVVAGQAVLVMEAMKMEYTLKTDIAGTIETVACLVGEQVVLGKVLVKIQPDIGSKAEK